MSFAPVLRTGEAADRSLAQIIVPSRPQADPAHSAIAYRPEIDGLRAIAVLSVVFYHAGLQTIKGGFLGVDLFFVISGYLITSILLKERSEGRYTLAGFYERRIRRILPALFVVTLCCLPAAWFLLLPKEMLDFSRSLIYVQLFVSNAYFRKHTDYFGPTADHEPMLHTWSLGIEEQYYVLFPLLLALLWRLRANQMLSAILAALFASLLYSQWQGGNDSTANFYLLPSRAWELMLGSAVAAYVFRRGMPSFGYRGDALLAGLGLLMVLGSLFALDDRFPSPGLTTLLPTTGAALIILFARGGNATGRLLGSRWMCGLGLISYSVYLWHQPLLAFVRSASLAQPTPQALAAAAALSLPAGYLSWRYVERPFRDRRLIGRRAVFVFAGVGMACFIALGAWGEKEHGFQSRYALPQSIETQLQGLGHIDCISYDGACLLGDTSAQEPTDVVLGDSHLLALVPAIDLAGKELKRRFAVMGAVGCPPLQGVVVLKRDATQRCDELNQAELKFLKAHRATIRRVVLVARWAFYVDGYYSGLGISYLGRSASDPWTRSASREAFELGFANTLRAIRSLGMEPCVVLQVPQPRVWVPDIYYRSYADPSKAAETFARLQVKWSTPLAEHLKLQSFNRALFDGYARRGELRLIDLDAVFCDTARCTFGTQDHPYYIDDGHLSDYGAALTADALTQYLR